MSIGGPHEVLPPHESSPGRWTCRSRSSRACPPSTDETACATRRLHPPRPESELASEDRLGPVLPSYGPEPRLALRLLCCRRSHPLAGRICSRHVRRSRAICGPRAKPAREVPAASA